MIFSSVAYKELGEVPAQVNRLTGELSINPGIWKNLPPEHKEFILLHEEGHLRLMTADEYETNRYAIGRYLKAGELTDDELNRRLTVLSEVLKPGYVSQNKTPDHMSNFDPVTTVLSIFGSLTNSISARIDSKNKEAETEILDSTAKAKSLLTKANNQRIMIIAGIVLIAVIALIIVFK